MHSYGTFIMKDDWRKEANSSTYQVKFLTRAEQNPVEFQPHETRECHTMKTVEMNFLF